jgi:murein L,D-transpeptidase YafK
MRGPLLIVSTLSALVLANPRVDAVRAQRQEDVARLLADAGVSDPPERVYLRAFKEEKQLELWAGRKGAALALVKTYPICAASGELGPKRREGDLQVPEGLYEVPEFNPGSNFHLSMKVSYPNASDRVRSDSKRPGGLIYLHGNCASIGCIAIEDGPIEEVYLIAQSARARPLRIDIFPARLTGPWLEAQKDSNHLGLWRELEPAYRQFEASRKVPAFTVGKAGQYVVKGP